MLRNGQPFLEDVEIRPTIAHAPEQAFFNLAQDCIYDCKFCASRKLDKRITKNLSPERVVQMAIEASKKPGFRSVAFTSAVVDSPEKTVERMLYVVRAVRQELPDVPIGVEPYLSKLSDVDDLKAAGADEIKLNIETFDPERFAKVCGKLHYEFVLDGTGPCGGGVRERQGHHQPDRRAGRIGPESAGRCEVFCREGHRGHAASAAHK